MAETTETGPNTFIFKAKDIKAKHPRLVWDELWLSMTQVRNVKLGTTSRKASIKETSNV